MTDAAGRGTSRIGKAPIPVGLCDDCTWAKVVASGKGSRFTLCGRHALDPRFPKYPKTPVMRCSGYEPGHGDGTA